MALGGDFRLDVLNPNGNDPHQSFADGAGVVDDKVHAPVNYHAFAACTHGTFHKKASTLADDQRCVLLLLRSDLEHCLKTLRTLKMQGRKVAVALKECGAFQTASQLATLQDFALFQKICMSADGCIATTEDLLPFYTAAGGKNVAFIPTPYPVEDERWDFSIPPDDRRGVFVGTREFDTPSRRHLAAILATWQISQTMDERVMVINSGGKSARQYLSGFRFREDQLHIVEGPVPYSKYLQFMAAHRLVFQLDASVAPGQVAGDTLLCKIPCVGGNGAIDKLVWKELVSEGRSVEQMIEIVRYFLQEPEASDSYVEIAQRRAANLCSYSAVAERLRDYFSHL